MTLDQSENKNYHNSLHFATFLCVEYWNGLNGEKEPYFWKKKMIAYNIIKHHEYP